MASSLSLLKADKATTKIILTVVGLIFCALNIGLSISFKVQGIAFNEAFFSHLDTTTARIAIKTEKLATLSLAVYLAIAPIIIYLSLGRNRVGKYAKKYSLLIIIGVVTSLYTNYPLKSLIYYVRSTEKSSQRLNEEIQKIREARNVVDIENRNNKLNLVLIYAESLEQNYLNAELFPNLTPNLNDLANESLSFRNLEQFPGTSWTIAGIVSSQCGIPLLSSKDGNSILRNADNPFAKITCLAEKYADLGYNTVYLGGASLEFAGKGRFLKDNGYNVALGIDELPNANSHSWGMYDTELFSYARNLFDELSDKTQPFLLTLLTLDTHHPNGTPSPGCEPYLEQRNSMLDAVHCSDRIIGDFIEYVKKSKVANTTVVAVLSDHLLINGDVKETLQKRDRKLLFLIVHPNGSSMIHLGSATHFDIGPTLLEATGQMGVEINFGQSLLSNNVGKAQQLQLTSSDLEAFRIENLVK